MSTHMLTETNTHLQAIRDALGVLDSQRDPLPSIDANVDLVITDREVAAAVMRDFPLPGLNRQIVYRTGNGYSAFATTVAYQLLLQANEARLGLRIRNSGAAAVTLILSKNLAADGTPLLAGAPSINLPATTGDWDGKLGDLMWGGSISVGGNISTVTVAEV